MKNIITKNGKLSAAFGLVCAQAFVTVSAEGSEPVSQGVLPPQNWTNLS